MGDVESGGVKCSDVDRLRRGSFYVPAHLAALRPSGPESVRVSILRRSVVYSLSPSLLPAALTAAD